MAKQLTTRPTSTAAPSSAKPKIVSQLSLLADEPLMRRHRIDRKTQELLAGRSAFATTWMVWLFDWYDDRPDGPSDEWNDLLTEWSPETIAHEIQAEMGFSPSPQSMARILAMRELLTSNSFYRRPWFFIHICQALWSGDLNPNRFVRIDDPAVIAWGVMEAMAISEPDDEAEAWSPEVLGYVRDVLERAGLVSCPAVLRAAMPGVFDPDNAVDWSSLPDQDTAALEAEFGAKQLDTDEIDEETSERFDMMMRQIGSLPLESGQVSGLSSLRAPRG